MGRRMSLPFLSCELHVSVVTSTLASIDDTMLYLLSPIVIVYFLYFWKNV